MNHPEKLFDVLKEEHTNILVNIKECLNEKSIKELESEEKVISDLNKALLKYINFNSLKKMKANTPIVTKK
jgi:hypothetical protein